MDGRGCLIVSLEVWTEKLHAFRQRHIRNVAPGLPAHIGVVGTIPESAFAKREDLMEAVQRACSEVPAFAYQFIECGWSEEQRSLYLKPEPADEFARLRKKVVDALGLDAEYRPERRLRLVLATDCERPRYEIEEEFLAENAGLLPLKCRAISADLYRKRGEEWVQCARFELGVPGGPTRSSVSRG